MRKIIKSDACPPESAFRLHYFPNIPVDGADSAGSSAAERTAFRRLDPEGGTPAGPQGGLGASRGQASDDAVDAQSRLAQQEAEAYRAGFEKGEAEGREAAALAAGELMAVLKNGLEELVGFQRRLQQHAENETVRLALAVAKKILAREVSLSPDVILNVVRSALRQTEETDRIHVRLHPLDLQCIQEASAGGDGLFDRPDALSFEADPSIGRGGCFIETDFGEIDARIEHQFRVVEDAFQAEMLLIDPIAPEDYP